MMMKNLPIGTVVLLKEGSKKLMICGRIQTRENSDEIYDYSGCLYPEGIIGPDSMFFFNQENIDTIYFIGFQDSEELDYRENYLNKLGELTVQDGMIVEKNSENHIGDENIS